MGCGGAQGGALGPHEALRTRIAELQADKRKDQRRIEDLENQLFLLQDRLATAEVERARVGVPSLPVEVLEPAPGEVAPTDEPLAGDPLAGDDERSAGLDGYQAGVDPDGTEIIYVGDAASDRTVRPDIRAYRDSYGSDGDGAPVASPAPPARAAAPAVPPAPGRGEHGSLGVTSAVPPVAARRAAELERPRPARPASADGDVRARYRRHYEALRAGQHAAAIAGFEAFLAQHPGHDYADNAQYWLAEAYYDQRQYRTALAEFRAVVTRYPKGNKVPDALLKMGFCYAALDQRDEARAVLEQLVEVYPATSPAQLAAQRLAKLQ